MKSQLQLLLALQSLDLEADEIRTARARIDATLGDFRRALDQLQEDLEGQRQQLAETEALHVEKTEEHGEIDDRHKKSKVRLGKVSNTKEYAAIEMEIETARRQTAQLEEELVQLSEAIETTRQATAEKEAKIGELRAQVSAEEGRAQSRLVEFDGRLGELTQRREGLARDIAKELIRRYAFIRSRRDGVAIVAARGGCCQGCFMQIPPQMYNELQQGDSLKSCPSCQRILYVEEMGIDGETAG